MTQSLSRAAFRTVSVSLLLAAACASPLAGCSSDDTQATVDGGATTPGSGPVPGTTAGTTSGTTGGETTGAPAGTTGGTTTGGTTGAPTNADALQILFFLGDGMGIPVMTAARIYAKGEDGDLTMDTLPESGFVRTYSSDFQVTDSAAAMTAYMTGQKTNNDVIGFGADTEVQGKEGTRLTTFLELAEAAGWSTGVVTTTRVTHATPAATYAHVSDRDKEEDIAAQLVPGSTTYNRALGDGLEVIFGGGTNQFLPRPDGGTGGRADGRNLVEEMQRQGYAYATTAATFATFAPATRKALALFTPGHMSYELDRKAAPVAKEPSLAAMTEKAMDILAANPKGYFLMVEGGRIDHALHETTAKKALEDTVAFDDAIAAALAKAKRTDPTLARTLIVVTADHDHTMTLNGYAARTGKTTADNAGILGLLRGYTGSKDVAKDQDGMPFTILGFGTGENRAAGKRSALAPLTDAVTSAPTYHQEAVVRMAPGGETHGGTDVAVMAIGRNAEEIHGSLENTAIFGTLKRAAGL